MGTNPQTGWQGAAKRFLDLAAAVTVFFFLWPLLLLLALLIRRTMGPPAVFKQERPGYQGKIFTVYKFRTMTEERDEKGELLPDEQRLTRLGTLIRSTSLDELPQLWNVLKGELSLVGPRPLLIEYLPRYSAEQQRRHDVKPGITGWAQVNGRNAISWPEKFAFDVWYVDHWSLTLDLKIIFLTAWKVVRREGISQDGRATMEMFLGNPEQKEDNHGT